MVAIVTRAGKGSALTNAEMDNNLNNLNDGKVEKPTGGFNGAIVAFADSTNLNIKVASGSEIATAIGASFVSNSTYATSSGSANTANSATSATTATTANSLDASNNYQVKSIGIGTTPSGVTGELRATGDITAYYSSDIRLKENIKNIGDPIYKLKKLNGVEFEWKDEFLKSRGEVDDVFNRKNDIGLIAQEVLEVMPEIVCSRQDGTLAVKYDRVVALLIEVCKSQQAQIEQLSDKLSSFGEHK